MTDMPPDRDDPKAHAGNKAAAGADLPELIAFYLDGTGKGRALDIGEWADPPQPENATGFVWLHLCRDAPDTSGLLEELGLDATVVEALTAEETRPRCTVHDEGVLLNLRGVNLDPGADLEDMVSVRFWITSRQVVGLWIRPLFAITDLLHAIRRGMGPVSPGDFVSKLALRLADRAEPLAASMNERIDGLEEAVLRSEVASLRPELSDLRRKSILLRRYMVPQKDALTTMEIEDVDWLSQRDRLRLREAAERVGRLGEDLDAIRDRSQIVHDQIMDRRAEVLNRRMLVIAVISSVFLPLSLIAGLLGMNVGGIPGKDSPMAFLGVVGLVLLIGAGLLFWLRRMGLFR